MRKALLLGILTGLVVVVLLIRFYPPGDDFSLENPFWNGLKDFDRRTKADSLTSLSEIKSPSPFAYKTLLFIIGSSGDYSQKEVSSLSEFLKVGGTVVLADDFGSGNSILEGLGIKTRFSERLLVDPLFRGKAAVLVKTVDLSEPLGDITSLLFNYPTSLEIEASEVRVLASSSSFSFLDDDMSGQREEDERGGPFPVIAEIGYGKGKMYLISDSSLFINSMLSEEGNDTFLEKITRGKKILMDTSHHSTSMLLRLRAAEIKIYQLVSRMEVKYSLLLALMILMVGMKFSKKEVQVGEDIEAILQRHPEWDKDTLKHVQRSRFYVQR